MIRLMFNRIYKNRRSAQFLSAKRIILVLLIVSSFGFVSAQQDSIVDSKVYQFNRKVEIPLNIVHQVVNYYGFQVLRRKPRLDPIQVSALNANDVWFFDRHAATQNYSYTTRENAIKASDVVMNIMLILPFGLALDKEVQKDWLDIMFLYLEAQAVNLSFSYTGPLLTTRARPFVYYPEIPLEEKLKMGSTDSFFSGHTSTTAAASFFMAKVYTDLHPETDGKKWMFYAAALVPPAVVGYFRYKGLKHFPTDVLTGIAVGAASGILIPHLHKRKKNENLTVLPYAGTTSGLLVQYKF
jgi:membrane-associated phospholipid phosphatase